MIIELIILIAQQTTPEIYGLGFPETTLKSGGVTKASMAGGAEIVINGQGYSHSSADHSPIFSMSDSTFKA